MPRKALGRGLEALLSDREGEWRLGEGAEGASLLEIEISKIRPNRYQPRRSPGDEEGIRHLALSLQAQGLLQPVVVRRAGSGYELIAGERRWRAATMAGFTRIPAIVKTASDKEMVALALIENLHRADLTPIEEAGAYQRLVTEFHLTQEEVAEQVGKDRSSIANALRLLALPHEVREDLGAGRITVGHAKALLSLPRSEEQRRIARQIVKEGLSVRETEEVVRQMRGEKAAPSLSRRVSEKGISRMRDLEERLQRYLGTRVHITSGSRGGRVIIEYYSQEELERILEYLLKEG